MGVLSSLFTAISGITAFGESISVTSNNVANVGTTAFKSSRASFGDLVKSSLGGFQGNREVGTGVFLSGVQSVFTQGSLQPTAVPTDLSIGGDGFFVVQDPAGSTAYTRSGQFRPNDSGQLVNPEGFVLQGFQADATGNITGATGPLNLTSVSASPKPTTKVTIDANLDSSSPTKTFAIADPAGTSNFSTSLQVFDSLGVGHLVTTYFSKTATANQWAFNVIAPAAEVTVGTPSTQPNDIVASGTLDFTTVGALDDENTTSYFNAGTTGIDFKGAAGNQIVVFDFGTSITGESGTGLDGTRQFGVKSSIQNQSQNGFGAGTLLGLTIEENGVVSGQFSNGRIQGLGQVQLARFNDPTGLRSIGNNAFTSTLRSGQPITGAPSTSGLGRALSSTLELSNVDIGKEFIDMITAQRAFQANSRVITTADEMLLELVNLKR